MNSNVKKRNKSLNKYLGSQKEKQKLIENTLKSNYNTNTNKEYDNFQSTISSIAKQLNNISLKSFSHTKTNPNKFSVNQKNFNFNISPTPTPNLTPAKSLKIINHNSFFIKGTNINMNIFNEKNEIKKENENLKENIKFLLGQIKKYQKGGITIEEEAKEDVYEMNNELKNIIAQKEKEIEKLNIEIKLDKKRMKFLEEEYNNLKEKYSELKNKYKNYFENINSPNTSSVMDENQLFQYNSKKNSYNTYYLNYENSKNNIENNDYTNQKFAFHKPHRTTDFSHNYFIRNNDTKKFAKDFENNNFSIKTSEDTSNLIIKKIKYPKKLKNIKYLSLMTSANKAKEHQNKINNNFPKSTKAQNTSSFLYKKSPIKEHKIKSSNVKNTTQNYFALNNSKFNIHKVHKKLTEILYHKKNNSISMLNNSNSQNINKINIPTSTGGSYTSSKISYIDDSISFPKLDTSPNDLYFFPNQINNDTIYNFKINEMKFSLIKYQLMDNSSFNYIYSAAMDHSYDILYSISNGFLIITGANTDYFYFYHMDKNKIFDLNKLNNSHNKGSLVKINNETIICISGINTTEVEMYNIKDNIWVHLPTMNCPHCESSYMVYNKNIIFSFFGYDYENNKYIEDIEYLIIKPYYKEKIWNKISVTNNLGCNLRNHSIFYRINKEKNNEKEIFIVGGYNNLGRNNGLIQILIEKEENDFKINFKKYEENKVKIKGNNQNLEKYNNNENIFIFQNEFYQFFDEEDNLFYNYNYDSNFNIHIIDNFTLKHTIYKNKLNN